MSNELQSTDVSITGIFSFIVKIAKQKYCNVWVQNLYVISNNNDRRQVSIVLVVLNYFWFT